MERHRLDRCLAARLDRCLAARLARSKCREVRKRLQGCAASCDAAAVASNKALNSHFTASCRVEGTRSSEVKSRIIWSTIANTATNSHCAATTSCPQRSRSSIVESRIVQSGCTGASCQGGCTCTGASTAYSSCTYSILLPLQVTIPFKFEFCSPSDHVALPKPKPAAPPRPAAPKPDRAEEPLKSFVQPRTQPLAEPPRQPVPAPVKQAAVRQVADARQVPVEVRSAARLTESSVAAAVDTELQLAGGRHNSSSRQVSL